MTQDDDDDDDDDDAVSDDSPSTPVSKPSVSSKAPQRVRKQEKVHSFSEAARAAERADEKTRIEACIKMSDLAGAEACLTRLAEKGNADAVSYNMIISLCAKRGASEKADEWMRRMLQAEVAPDVASFNSNIDACARSGDFQGAERRS